MYKVLFFTLLMYLPSSWGSLAAEEDTPVMFDDLMKDLPKEKADPWYKPDYSNQENALGYETGAFAIPAGMEERVSFWMDIYTKYSTDQGLLHDSQHVHLVYEAVDFRDIMKDPNLSDREKQKARKKKVDDAKEIIAARLKRLHKLNSPAGLEGEDLRYWYLFSKIEGANKFVEAAQKGRLRFQLGQRDRFIQGIYSSGRYLQRMEGIFREMGLPVELTRLPFVESSFNLNARSKVGASGIWQFMRYSAKPYLKMNAHVDERNDPIKATIAAAKLLRSNYNMLNSWPLAVTGYNHGPSGVLRLTKRFKTNDLVVLMDERHGRFGFASANFYASFLAAVETEKNADKFFGLVYREKSQAAEEIVLAKNISLDQLINWFDGDLARTQLYNPHIRSHLWKHKGSLASKNFIRIPTDKKEQVVADLRNLNEVPLAVAGGSYQISRGETLGGIAREFGTTVRALLELNNIDDPRRIRAGQKIAIPAK